jgi:hypothetical protein
MSNPRVYVGTYGKYNSGSIAGGWISLNDCKDYGAFLSKCHALHKRERDPEFMIQDREDFPDGLNCGEWLSEQDFNDVKQACNEEEQEELSFADALRAVLLGKATPMQKARVDDKALFEDYMAEWQKVWPGDERMLDYERKKFSYAVRLENGGILYFEKPSIKTEFCFGYSSCGQGPEYDEANEECRAANSENYFLQANLGSMDEEIKALECNCRYDWEKGEGSRAYDGMTWYLVRQEYCNQTEQLNLYEFHAYREWDIKDKPWIFKEGNYIKMSDADRMTILEAMRHERNKFEKRLRTYLKRYGTSKLRTWTYWLDE